jgi:hypothetical protein
MSSPSLRIDYAQHAWAAIGHGASLLRLPGDDDSPRATKRIPDGA